MNQHRSISLFKNKDLGLIFQEEKPILAHKYTLISRSPVFCAMFTGPATDENTEIKIEDVDKTSFHEMLRLVLCISRTSIFGRSLAY